MRRCEMLRQTDIELVPVETARVAHAAFPDGHRYIRLADELGTLFTDALFTALYPSYGQPALSPWRLALVTMLQFAEGLSDRQAADAVRSRIDWKYLLRLELTDSGFDGSVLSEFRSRLLLGEADYLLFDHLLAWCRERQLVIAGGRQRTDSTHILAAVRALNRIELVGETLRHALNRLAVVAPAWLQAITPPKWVERYARRAEDDRLPTKQAARDALAATIGEDGYTLLTAIYDASSPQWLRDVPALDILRRVWLQNYLWDDAHLIWRASDNIPPATQFISSPYDLEAHYARKHTTQWVGYKIHITEACDDDRPHLITHVATTAGPVADGDVTPVIHTALQARQLLPSTHIVDTGFLDAELMVDSQDQYGIDLFGPARQDYHWQAQEGQGFDAQHFHIDWEQQQATCPEGKTSISWTPAIDKRTNDVIKIKFSTKDCRHCPQLKHCVRSKKRYVRRTLTIRPKRQFEALQAARQRESTKAFQKEYDRRAGIEGTISRGTRVTRLRRTRYRGQARVQLGHILTGLGINALRLGEWFLEQKRAKTRRTPFERVMAAAA
jgi:transposase